MSRGRDRGLQCRRKVQCRTSEMSFSVIRLPNGNSTASVYCRTLKLSLSVVLPEVVFWYAEVRALAGALFHFPRSDAFSIRSVQIHSVFGTRHLKRLQNVVCCQALQNGTECWAQTVAGRLLHSH